MSQLPTEWDLSAGTPKCSLALLFKSLLALQTPRSPIKVSVPLN